MGRTVRPTSLSDAQHAATRRAGASDRAATTRATTASGCSIGGGGACRAGDAAQLASAIIGRCCDRTADARSGRARKVFQW